MGEHNCVRCNKYVAGSMQAHLRGCGNGPLPHRPCPECQGPMVPYSGHGDWLCLGERRLWQVSAGGRLVPLAWRAIEEYTGAP